MFRLVKVLVLLALIACAGLGVVYLMSRPASTAKTGAPGEVRSRESDKPRVEEKYGFTSETP
jgi:hypothetical protein